MIILYGRFMPRISEERKAEQKAKIVGALLDSMREKGIADTSMADVISRSGLSSGAIYGYYSSKDDILLDAAREVVGSRVEVFDSFVASAPVPSPPEVVERLVSDLPAFVVEKRSLLQIWGLATTNPAIAAIGVESIGTLSGGARAYLEAWFRQEGDADPARRAELAAPAFLALAQGYMIQTAIGLPLEPRGYRKAVDALFLGLQGLTEGER